MRKRLAIIHFSPLELYPPVQNLIHILGQEDGSGQKILIFTTHTVVKGIDRFTANTAKIKLVRIGWSGQGIGLLKRYFTYFAFNTFSILYLVLARVNKLLYYETISAYPAYIYTRFIKRSAKLYIHYHEYNSPEEYRSGMRLVHYFHRLETKLYPSAAWLSHTNAFRMELFLKDIAPVQVPNTQLVPNYPPMSWHSKQPIAINKNLRILYVGALSIDTMYVREFADWVNMQNGSVQWDIYSTNTTPATDLFLKSLDSKWIKLCGAVNYTMLPSTMQHYQVGVILYKGLTSNYTYNAPNKLFEYLACGLDVWFPDVMRGSLPYVTDMTYPKVVAFDFSKLAAVEWRVICDKSGLTYKPGTFFCEQVLESLCKQLLNNA